MINLRGTSLAICLLFGVASHAQAATNLVINGGFEDGNTGWTFFAPWGPLPAPNAGLTRFDGDWVGSTACSFSCPLDQSLPTVAGQSYNLSFAYNAGEASGLAGTPGFVELKVYWGTTLVKDILGGPIGWNEFTINNLVAPTESTQLEFVGIKVPNRIGLDDVSVSGVPEPATWIMMILGFGFVGASLRRARSRLAISLA